MNEDKDQKEFSAENDVNFELRNEKTMMHLKTWMKNDRNAMKIKTEAVIDSIIMKKNHLIAAKFIIKGDMQ